MKFVIPSGVFAGVAGWAAKVLPHRPALPVLAGLLLTAADGAVTIAASDYDIWARARVDADIQQDGAVLIPGRMLAQIAAQLPAGDLQVSADATAAELACRRARFTLRTLPADQYPVPPAMPPVAGEVAAADFAAAAAGVTIAASTDDTVPELTAVCVDFDGAGLTLAATDRYRLAVRELPWQPCLDAPTGRLLASARIIGHIAKTMTGEQTLGLGLARDSGSQEPTVLGVRAGGRDLITRLIPGEYISYATLLAQKFTAHAQIDTAAFAEAVARVGVTAERETPIQLDFSPGRDNELTLAAGCGDAATGRDVIAVSFDGTEPVTLLFHPRRLQDALTALGASTTCVAITGPDRPVLFTATPASQQGHPIYRHLLCTIRPRP